MDEAFLDEDCQLKDSDGLEDLDLADEEALLELTDDEELDGGEELQNDEIQFVDEEGNPVEMGEGDLELYDIGDYNNQEYSATAIEVEADEDVLEVDIDGEFDSLSQENTDASFIEKKGNVEVAKIESSAKNQQKHSVQTKNKSVQKAENIKQMTVLEQVEIIQGVQAEKEEKIVKYSSQADEESEEENPDGGDDHRERFRSERANVINISSAKKRSDIPDTLDSVIPVEEAAKVSEFLAREQERKNRFRKPRQRFKGSRGASNQGMGLLGKQPLLLPMRGQIPIQPVHPTLQSPPFSYSNSRLSQSVQRSSYNSHPPSRKILINPHFRGPRPSVSEEPASVMISRQSQLLPNPHPSHMYGGRNVPNQTTQALLPPPMQNMGPRLPPPQQGQYRPLMEHPPPIYHGEHQLPHNRDLQFDQRICPPTCHNIERGPDMYHPSLNNVSSSCLPQNDLVLNQPQLSAVSRVCDTSTPRLQPPMSNAWNPITSQPNLSQPPMPLPAAPPRPNIFESPFRGSMLQSSVPNTTFRENTVAPAVPQMIQMPNFQTPPPPTNPPVSLPPTHIPPPNHQPPFPPTQMPIKANIHLPQQQFRSPPDYIPSLMSLPLQPSSYPRNVQKDLSLQSQYNINATIQRSNQQQHNIQSRMASSHMQLSASQRRYKAHMQRKRSSSDDKIPALAKQQRLDNRKQWKGTNTGRKQAIQNSNIKEVPIVETLPVSTASKAQLPIIEEDEQTKELRRKIEEQKKLREQILRRKEERRRMMATERMKELQQRLNEQKQQQQQQQQQQHQQHITTNKPTLPDSRGKNSRLTVKQRIGVSPQMQKPQITGTKSKKILVVRKKQQQQPNISSQNNSTVVNLKTGQQRGNTILMKKQPNVQQVVLKKRTVAPPSARTQQGTIKNAQNFREQRTVIPRGYAIQQQQRHVIHIKTNDDVPQFNRKVLTPAASRNVARTQRKINLTGNNGNGDTSSAQQHCTTVVRTQTVLVENLTASTNETQLSQLCSSIGPIESIQLQRKERKAIIKFKDSLHASNFQKKYQRHMLDLSLIQVSLIST